MMRNIGEDQKGIRDNKKRDRQEKEKLQKQFGKKKKKLSRKNQEFGNGLKRMKTKQATQSILTMNYKNP